MDSTADDDSKFPITILEDKSVLCGKRIDTRHLVIQKKINNKIIREEWEVIHRLPHVPVYGVYVIPIIQYADKGPCDIILIDKGGRLDPGECAEAAAVRELHEETGYLGKAISSSPGILSEGAPVMKSPCKNVTVLINGDEFTCKPKQSIPHDQIELIQVIVVKLNDLLNKLDKFSGDGCIIQNELYTFAQGIKLANITGGIAF